MRLRVIFAAVMFGTLAMSQSASALSCARPNLVDVLEEVKTSPNLYYILRGNFESRAHATPLGEYKGGPFTASQSEHPTQARFYGVSLAPGRGADRHLDGFRVKIRTSCIGPWCASAPSPESSVIAFVEAGDGGKSAHLNIGPCPKYVFEATPENIQTLRSCLKSTCASAPGAR